MSHIIDAESLCEHLKNRDRDAAAAALTASAAQGDTYHLLVTGYALHYLMEATGSDNNFSDFGKQPNIRGIRLLRELTLANSWGSDALALAASTANQIMSRIRKGIDDAMKLTGRHPARRAGLFVEALYLCDTQREQSVLLRCLESRLTDQEKAATA